MMVLAYLAWLLAGVGVLHAVAALVTFVWFRRRAVPAAGVARPVTLLKPLHGLAPGLAGLLGALLEQRHGAPVQAVFGVRDPADPAAALAERVLAERVAAGRDGAGRVAAGRDGAAAALTGRVVRDPRLHGPNRKISNLCNMLPAAEHELLVIADADMGAPPGYLAAVTAPLADPAVGLVTCLYRATPLDGGLWSGLAAQGVNWHFLPNAVLGETLGLARGCYGSTMALRRATLERVGGFGALVNTLADDNVLGERVRGLGLRVEISPLLVEHTMQEAGLAALLSHELRWARTVRLVSPAGYAGMLITHPLAFALLGCALWPAGFSVAVLAASFAARLALALAVDHLCGPRPAAPLPRWLLVPLRDLLSFAVFLGGCCGGRVSWQGRRYQVARDGRMSEIGDAARPAPPPPAPASRAKSPELVREDAV